MQVAPIPFTPSHVSVNRVRVVDLPGIHLDAEMRDQLAYDLVSVRALSRYAHEVADELRLPQRFHDAGPETRGQLPYFIAASLVSPDAQARGAAAAVVRRLGRNLGCVLLTLHRGDPVNREARGDWHAADWERWAQIKRVWLAGGLASGLLGESICAAAREWLAEVGAGDALDLALSPLAGATSLVGAARYLPPATGAALCFDFGQTSAKRAIVCLNGNAIADVGALPSVALFGEWPVPAEPDPDQTGARYRDFVVDVICDSLARARQHHAKMLEDMMVCVAAYVDGGRLLGNGTYATLMRLTDDARTLLGEAIARRTGRSARVHLIHDGTAAAAVFAGRPQTAVIALGTALGVGFPPATGAGLRRIDVLPMASLADPDYSGERFLHECSLNDPT